MRIIAGKNRSRLIYMVGLDTTRETTDKVRGAIFNLISEYHITGTGLDLFSGSGAMGLEGLSRGLDFCYFNDVNKKAYQVTKKNVTSLGYLENSKIFNLDYKAALKQVSKKLDFVFLDPPYAMNPSAEIANYLFENNLLNQDSLIICEVGLDTKIELGKPFEVYKDRAYGIRRVVIYRMCGESDAL